MMKQTLLLLALICVAGSVSAQYVYTIKADSVKLIGCDSSELIIENHTQAVPGFLFNTGKGRTIFKRGVVKINGGLYLIGADTLNLNANAWMQGGNSFGAIGILGTLDNNHLDFYTADTQRIRLTNRGNLLVGTTTDNGNTLQVKGASFFTGKVYVNANSGDGTGQLFLQTAANDFSNMLGSDGYNMLLQTRNVGASFEFRYGTSNSKLLFGGNNGGNIVISSPNNAIDFYGVNNINGGSNSSVYITSNNYSNSDGVVVQRFTRSALMTDPIFTVIESDTTVFDALKNGNVGLGTSTPSAQLHTTGTVRFAGLTSDTTKTRVIVSDASGNLYYRDAATLAANGILNADLANGKAVLPALAVNGTVSAQRLNLSQTGWPDYVFDSSYRLPDLSATEEYIKKYSHLPGISPATEVERKGLDVGDHEAAVLKKIEEMTLYIISQEKKLKAQEQQIVELQLKNKELDNLKQEMAEMKKMIGK